MIVDGTVTVQYYMYVSTIVATTITSQKITNVYWSFYNTACYLSVGQSFIHAMDAYTL